MKKSKFIDVFDDVTKQGTKIPTNLYLENGLYPIIDQGQSDIAGYTNESNGLFTDVPAIIFGDHTRIIKYVDTSCFLGADGVKLLKAKNPKANYKYLYYALCNTEIPNTGYNRHFKWLKEIEIPNYSEQVQNDIVMQLEKVDQLISLRKQQLAKLDELVKSRFIEMFGDPVADSMHWGQVPLSHYLKSIRYGTSTPPSFSETGYEFIRATNIKNGKIVSEDMKYISEEEAQKIEKCKVLGGEMIIVRSGVNAGDTCIITDEYRGQYAGYDMILVFTEELHPVFVNVLINTGYMDRVVKPLTRRAAQPHLNSEQVQNFPIIQVPYEQQKEFAAFVEQIDKSKFEIQKSLEKLETLKKALMQKYFG